MIDVFKLRLLRRPFWLLCFGLASTAFFLFLWPWTWHQQGYLKIGSGGDDRAWQHLSSQISDLENPLGLNHREARLADRVRGMQDENQILRHQLSVSQNQLMSVLANRQSADSAASVASASAALLPGQRKIKGQFQRQLKQQEKPCDKDSGVPNCETLEVSIVCAGHNNSRTVVTLIKSILFYRRHPIRLHLIVDDSAKLILETLFKTWIVPKVEVLFYSIESVTEDVSWVPNKHYSGIYGLIKLTLPKLLPATLSKVIVFDTDLLLVTDISKLWRLFNEFSSSEALGLVENQSDWYIPGKLWKSHSPWPALGRGFNTGVILMQLDKLRRLKWSQLWRLTAEKDLVTQYGTSLADQDIFNAVIREHPNLVHTLPCTWNLQLSDNTKSESCYASGNVQDLNILHFNSPKKLNVKNKNVEYFRNQFLTFLQFDGNLLRQDLINCNVTSSSTTPTESPSSKNEDFDQDDFFDKENNAAEEDNKDIVDMSDGDNLDCYDFREARNKIYRTHLYFIDYETPSADDVTLIAQLSLDRLHMIERICEQWDGPISLALYLSDSEADQVLSFVQNSDILKLRKNVGYHVVFKEGDYYPINYLRNVALDNVRTDYVFLSDIDFVPGADAYMAIKKAAQTMLKRPDAGRLSRQKLSLVVPAFETQRYRLSTFPKSKADVLHLLDEGTLLTFRYHIWPQGHAATNYAKWKTATTPYKISWEPDFEPYLVLPTKIVPKYDNRFVGFGWNKVSHVMELDAAGFEFLVLPNVFIVHMPHAPSLDIAKYRTSKIYRRCLDLFKKEFIEDMKNKYDRVFDSQQQLL